jgi:hypothetical protein
MVPLRGVENEIVGVIAVATEDEPPARPAS